jgi:hypothetical protein
MTELSTFPCPRCRRAAEERFYGPCRSCRAELAAGQRGDVRELETARFEPKLNVVPNHVATKD